MEILKTILRTLILPPAAPLLIIALGGLCLRRHARLGLGLIAVAAAALWLMSLMIVARPLERLAEHYAALDPGRLAATRAQAIVILGGGGQRAYAPEYAGPAADARLLERLAYGAWLARRTNLPVLVTGRRIEAAAMRDTLVRNFAVRPRWVEDRAYDTFENAHNCARMLSMAGVHRILRGTSAAHLWRAAHEFTAAGFDVIPAPVHVWTPVEPEPTNYLPTAEALLVSNSALHELIGEPVREFLAWPRLRRQ